MNLVYISNLHKTADFDEEDDVDDAREDQVSSPGMGNKQQSFTVDAIQSKVEVGEGGGLPHTVVLRLICTVSIILQESSPICYRVYNSAKPLNAQ